MPILGPSCILQLSFVNLVLLYQLQAATKSFRVQLKDNLSIAFQRWAACSNGLQDTTVLLTPRGALERFCSTVSGFLQNFCTDFTLKLCHT